MKKRLLVVICMIVLFSVAVYSELFEWQVLVQGGNYSQQFYLGDYGRGTSLFYAPQPAPSNFSTNAYLYEFKYGRGYARDSCSSYLTATVEPGIFSHSGRLNRAAGGGSYDYLPVSSISVVMQRNQRKVNWYSGRTCKYAIGGNYKIALEIHRDEYFVNRRHGAKDMGPLRKYLPANVQIGSDQEYKIHSRNPSVLMWFIAPGNANTSTTTDVAHHIYACEDSDRNNECDCIDSSGSGDCDIGQADLLTCQEPDEDGNIGDWYAAWCCRHNTNTPPGSIVSNFTIINPDKSILLYQPHIPPTLCGENEWGDPEWAPITDVGGVHTLTLPSINLVSDGTDHYYCGGDTSSTIFAQLNPKPFNYLNITFGGYQHTFSCGNNTITECPGDDYPMSAPPRDDAASLGEIISTVDGRQYCTDKGTFDIDLDNYPKACEDAIDLSKPDDLEKWTGHYCCSEDLDVFDSSETYNDPFDPLAFYDPDNATSGGCWDTEYIQSGSWIGGMENKIINAQGVFYGCHVTDTHYTNPTDLHTNITVLQDAGTCGKLDLGGWGRPEGRYVVCQPWGEFTFAQEDLPTTIKNIFWNTSAVSTTATLHDQGCCPNEQCWNGEYCQSKGSYYTAGEEGYLCN